MRHIFVTDLSGNTRRANAEPGQTLMEIIRNAGVDDLLAMCGGNCACATCHVYVDPSIEEILPHASEGEADLLETVDVQPPRSRLSCQLIFTPELDGASFAIAPR